MSSAGPSKIKVQCSLFKHSNYARRFREHSTVKFRLSSQARVVQVLKSARKLRTVDGYESVYICPDRSAEERKAYKKLVEELKKKRDSETDKVYYIRHNKIVSYSKNSEPAKTGKE